MRDPFWKSSVVILRYKRQLALGLAGAVVSAACFGSGLGMILPTLQLLLGEKLPLRTLVEDNLTTPDRPPLVQDVGAWLLDQLPSDPYHGFLLVMATIASLTVIGSCARYLHEMQTLTVVARAVMLWRARMVHRLIQAQLGHLLSSGHADYTSRIGRDAYTLGYGYRAVLGKAFAKVLNGIVAVGVAVWIDWRLTIIAMVGTPLIAVLLRKFGKKVRRASKQILLQQGQMIALLNESLGSIRVVKAHVAEGYERRRFRRLNRSLYEQEMRLRRIRALSGPLIETLGLFGIMAVASVAAWYVLRLDVAPERFMTVLAALGAAAASLRPIADLHNQLQEARAAATRVLDTLETPIDAADDPDEQALPALAPHRKDVTFEHVSYTYADQATPAVNGVCLRIEHGQNVAIVGSNGSGKTTLLSLLPRLLDLQKGIIRIDGHDITTVSLRSLRRQIAIVPQQTILFEGSIATNIAYGRGYEPRTKIIAAAKAAYAHEFIVDLPLGYDTLLTEGGEGLSGGQKQRLSIARAILREPAILILDEATSQIDADSERKINQALRALRQQRTTLVIAHRLSTVIDADLIVVMADGRIVDHGTHHQLLERCAPYQTLTHHQLQPTE